MLFDSAAKVTALRNGARFIGLEKPSLAPLTGDFRPAASVSPVGGDGETTVLLWAIDRPMFGVHLDPVNLVNCPSRYYHNADFLRECFSKLGQWIVSCHGKDVIMHDQLTVHLDEVRSGLGTLDYLDCHFTH
ncbi:MAG: hypothetical protein V3S14_02465 [Anaerolineae bacterium]